MAVVDVSEIWNGRFGSEDEKAIRQYARVFRVITDSILTGPAEVSVGNGLPRRFDAYQDASGYTDTLAIAQSIDIRQTDDPFTWEVVCHYSNRTDEPALGETDPISRPTEIEVDFEQFQRVAENDIKGNPIYNSAGERFDPPAEMDDSRPVIIMTRIEASLDYATLLQYQDAVNSKPWLGFAAKTVKLRIKARRHYENNVYYWQITYTFSIRWDTWELKTLDQGYFFLDSNGNRQMITDKFGQPLAAPALLDGSGNQLAYSVVAKKFNSIFLVWDVYNSIDFNLLNLP